jgi:hypothetical protein
LPLRPDRYSNTGTHDCREAKSAITGTNTFSKSLPLPSPSFPGYLSLPTTGPTSFRSRTQSFESSTRSDEPKALRQTDTRMRVSHLLE